MTRDQQSVTAMSSVTFAALHAQYKPSCLWDQVKPHYARPCSRSLNGSHVCHSIQLMQKEGEGHADRE